MRKEEISVIISCFNQVEFLINSLLSLSCQSYLPDEVIITDDGSETDIIANIRNRFPKLPFSMTYIKQEHKGFRLAKIRNNAIRIATGSFLIFNDQDIIHTRDYIKTFVDNKKKKQFLVAYPVRLTAAQSSLITEDSILNHSIEETLIHRKQQNKIRKVFYQDRFEYIMKNIFRTTSYKPKLRGGVFGIYKEDLFSVDGFDENYIGWGNEDDDLGRRLYQYGVIGKNCFYNQFPIHLYHPPRHIDAHRVNKAYYQERSKQIRLGEIRAARGLSNPIEEKLTIIKIT